MIEESTDDDQVASCTRCAFISQGFCEHWKNVLRENVEFCYTYAMVSYFLETESEFSINAAASAEATIAQAAYVDNHFGPGWLAKSTKQICQIG